SFFEDAARDRRDRDLALPAIAVHDLVRAGPRRRVAHRVFDVGPVDEPLRADLDLSVEIAPQDDGPTAMNRDIEIRRERLPEREEERARQPAENREAEDELDHTERAMHAGRPHFGLPCVAKRSATLASSIET